MIIVASEIQQQNKSMGSIASEVVILSADGDDDDVSVLFAKPADLRKMGSQSNNPILVETYSDDKGLSLALMPPFISTRKKSKRGIDLSLEDYSYVAYGDGDDIRVYDVEDSIPGTKRKYFNGQPPNSNNKVDGFDPTFICDICVDEKPRNGLFLIKGCAHFYCSECISKYIDSRLQENVTKITCPVWGCEGRLEPGDCRSILPSRVFDRWGRAIYEAESLASGKFYCPFGDCSALMKGADEAIAETRCPKCRRMVCTKCRAPWHSRISCEEFQMLNRDEREEEDLMLLKLARQRKWKRCPSCRVYVSRNRGCNHMRCRCGQDFDYRTGDKYG